MLKISITRQSYDNSQYISELIGYSTYKNPAKITHNRRLSNILAQGNVFNRCMGASYRKSEKSKVFLQLSVVLLYKQKFELHEICFDTLTFVCQKSNLI